MTVIMDFEDLVTKKDLESNKEEIIQAIEKRHDVTTCGKWLRSAEVRKMLRISAATLQNLRIKRLIPYTKIGDTLYYPLDEINKVLEENLIK